MFYESDRYPNERHFYAALLERSEDVTPTRHDHADEMLAWVHLADGLPRK